MTVIKMLEERLATTLKERDRLASEAHYAELAFKTVLGRFENVAKEANELLSAIEVLKSQ